MSAVTALQRDSCAFSEIRVSSVGYSPPDGPLKSLNPSQLFKQFSVTSELLLLGSPPTPEGALLSLFASQFLVEKVEGVPW